MSWILLKSLKFSLEISLLLNYNSRWILLSSVFVGRLLTYCGLPFERMLDSSHRVVVVDCWLYCDYSFHQGIQFFEVSAKL